MPRKRVRGRSQAAPGGRKPLRLSALRSPRKEVSKHEETSQIPGAPRRGNEKPRSSDRMSLKTDEPYPRHPEVRVSEANEPPQVGLARLAFLRTDVG